MKLRYWVIAFVAGAALASVWHLSREPAGESAGAPAAAVVAPPAVASSAMEMATTAPQAEAAPAADQVSGWLADVNSADASKRAAALAGLARAPRAQALPVLRNQVLSGDPVDRPLALNSLRELALDQGDADGGIRAVIREVIYHGDDEALAAGAQDALDVVEESELK